MAKLYEKHFLWGAGGGVHSVLFTGGIERDQLHEIG